QSAWSRPRSKWASASTPTRPCRKRFGRPLETSRTCESTVLTEATGRAGDTGAGRAIALPPCRLLDLSPGPSVPYELGVALQERFWRERVAGDRSDTLVFLQHPPTYTLGRGARPEHLLFDAATRHRLGIAVCESSRGGDITYHGPGQLVGYPILDLSARGR